jgi:hypothetical protein
MIYLPGRNDLFQIIKTLGTIQLFWQAVPRINHLYGSYHSRLGEVVDHAGSQDGGESKSVGTGL